MENRCGLCTVQTSVFGEQVGLFKRPDLLKIKASGREWCKKWWIQQRRSDLNRRYWWTCQIWQSQILLSAFYEILSLFGTGCLHHLKGIVHPKMKTHCLLTLISIHTWVSLFNGTQKMFCWISVFLLIFQTMSVKDRKTSVHSLYSSLQKSYDSLRETQIS